MRKSDMRPGARRPACSGYTELSTHEQFESRVMREMLRAGTSRAPSQWKSKFENKNPLPRILDRGSGRSYSVSPVAVLRQGCAYHHIRSCINQRNAAHRQDIRRIRKLSANVNPSMIIRGLGCGRGIIQ
jgi:hypothetical protein